MISRNYYQKISNIKNEVLNYVLKETDFKLKEQKRIIRRVKCVKLRIISSKKKEANSLKLRAPIKICSCIIERKPVLTIKENSNYEYFLFSLVHEYIHLLSTKLVKIGKDKCYYQSGIMRYDYSSQRLKFKLTSTIGDENLNEIVTDMVTKHLVQQHFGISNYVVKDNGGVEKFYKKYGNDVGEIMVKLLKNKLDY